MANTLSNTGIVTGQTVEALQVSQSVDAFTGANDYDITISGSLTLTGSLFQTGSIYFKQLVNTPATASNQLGAVMIDVDGRLYSGSSSVGAQGAAGEKVKTVLQVLKVHQLQEHKVLTVLKELQDLQVEVVLKVLQVKKELKVHKEQMV